MQAHRGRRGWSDVIQGERNRITGKEKTMHKGTKKNNESREKNRLLRAISGAKMFQEMNYAERGNTFPNELWRRR